MTKRSLSLAAFLALGAISAVAQQYNNDYESALLSRALSSSDKEYCDGKAGSDKDAYRACHVTRNYMADIMKDGCGQKVPPSADIVYTRGKDERARFNDCAPKA